MLAIVLLLPLAGYLANVAFGRRLSKRTSGTIACASIGGSFVVAAALVRSLVALGPEMRVIEQTLYTWIPSGDFNAPFTLRLDPLAAVMVLVVTGIGFLIHVYSIGYMKDERDSEYARYFSYLNLFAFFMLVLVLGANFLVMFVGWEGVGLCSYLLIGFWFAKPSAADAGKKAFIVNRVGDVAFVLGILVAFVQFGTIDFRELGARVASLRPEAGFGVISVMTLLLFIGATGKSAQIPLYVWLPDAMEGPTPVSALIHAATMVTAGVYMIGRNAELFSHAPLVLGLVAVVGVTTAFFAGTIGLVQHDIKRVLAYSTVSQLGYMFLAMGVGAFAAGIFHLFTHAFFKALLFLGSGAVIHALSGEQDLRNMGGLRRALPVTYWTFLVGALAIAGVPLLSGFFSKDEILFRTFSAGHPVLWTLAVLSSLLTSIYMFRLVFLAFHGPSRAGAIHAIHDAPRSMAIPLILLAAGAVLAGYLGVPHALGGENRIEEFLAPSFSAHPSAIEPGEPEPAAIPEESLEMALMAVSVAVAGAGIFIAAFFFSRRPDRADALARRAGGVYRLLLNKYYVDELYDRVLVHPINALSTRVLWRNIDAAFIDGAVNGMGAIVRGTSAGLRRIQTGSVRAYAASLFIGVIVILGYYLYR